MAKPVEVLAWPLTYTPETDLVAAAMAALSWSSLRPMFPFDVAVLAAVAGAVAFADAVLDEVEHAPSVRIPGSRTADAAKTVVRRTAVVPQVKGRRQARSARGNQGFGSLPAPDGRAGCRIISGLCPLRGELADLGARHGGVPHSGPHGGDPGCARGQMAGATTATSAVIVRRPVSYVDGA